MAGGIAPTLEFVCECGAVRIVSVRIASRIRYCKACQKTKGNREKQRRYRERHPEVVAVRRARYRDRNLALLRERRSTPEGQAANREKAARYVAELRQQLFDAYGRACKCCGETEPAFLTFDHPESDGADQRRVYGGAISEWRAVRRAGFPVGYYAVLCFNCNCGRQRNGGICPHQAQTLRAVA